MARDHRQNLRKANNAFQNDEEPSRFKAEVTNLLSNRPLAVLLDPKVSAAQGIAQQAIPPKRRLVAVGSTGYTGDVTDHHAQVIPGRTVEKTKRTGDLLIGIINNGLSILNVSIELQLVAKGIITMLALAPDRCLQFEK